MSSGLHVVRAGDGPPLLFIHGSAADHRSWSIQLASPLRDRFTLLAYDRRGDASIEDHADDAAALLDREVAGTGAGRAVVVGSSFGAVIALELIRRHAARVAGAVLIEPPLAVSDDLPSISPMFVPAFDQRVASDGGPAAGEMFLRVVLGDAAFERMPRAFQLEAMNRFAEIRADSVALLAYRPRYAELAAVITPALLVGGDRSAPRFRPTLEALHAAIPGSRLEILAGASHLLHAEVPRRFNALVSEFAAPLLGALAPG
jgi:pimeloyl-ACP methyl ester carboxylesterase